MVNEASLQDLNDRLAKDGRVGHEDARSVDIQRFRPNLLIGGSVAPFCEDSWDSLDIGHVKFQVAGISSMPFPTEAFNSFKSNFPVLRTKFACS